MLQSSTESARFLFFEIRPKKLAIVTIHTCFRENYTQNDQALSCNWYECIGIGRIFDLNHYKRQRHESVFASEITDALYCVWRKVHSIYFFENSQQIGVYVSKRGNLITNYQVNKVDGGDITLAFWGSISGSPNSWCDFDHDSETTHLALFQISHYRSSCW